MQDGTSAFVLLIATNCKRGRDLMWTHPELCIRENTGQLF